MSALAYKVIPSSDGFIVRVIRLDSEGEPEGVTSYPVTDVSDIDEKIAMYQGMKTELEAFIASQTPPPEPPQ